MYDFYAHATLDTGPAQLPSLPRMTDWAKLKVVDLKAELKRRDLPQHGLKVELVARLEQSDEEAQAPTDEAAPEDDGEAENEHVPDAEEAPASVEETQEEQEPEPVQETSDTKEPEDAQAIPAPEVDMTDATADAPVTPTQEEPPSSLAVEKPTTDDSQKRKRKSTTPSPSDQEMAAKRARAMPEKPEEEEAAAANSASAAELAAKRPSVLDAEQTPAEPPSERQSNENKSEQTPQQQQQQPPPSPLPAQAAPEDNQMDIDDDETVAPALYPATTALYISNLMRPLRPADVQAHVCDLAAGKHGRVDEDVIVRFHLDQIRTHAFVVLSSTRAAARVRSQLHDRVWPNESNRKPLSVDFVPPEKVADWIDMEERSGSGGRRSTTRFEVIYTTSPDGIVEAKLQQAAGGSGNRPGPPPAGQHSKAGGSNVLGAPLGPRGGSGRDRDQDRGRDRGRDRERDLDRDRSASPPRGPRGGGDRDGNPRKRQAPSDLDYDAQRTRSRPTISYQLVSPELARRRVDNMRSFYTTDSRRELGREINRYSFEEGDGFVDRGKEVFEGIRPPHRERERRGRGGKFGGRGGGGGRGRGGGGGQGGPFRPRSDRYLPGLSGGGGGRGGGDGSGGGGGGRRWDDDRGRDRDRDRRY